MADGSAEATWTRWIEAQGGTADESALEQAPVVREVTAPRAGGSSGSARTRSASPRSTSARAGASRSDTIDHAVGVVCRRKRGDRVEAGEVLAEVHARTTRRRPSAAREVAAAYELGDDPGPARPLLLEVIA